MTGRILILPISRTARIAISGLGHTQSSHSTVATFYTSPRRSPIAFYHLPHSPALPTICTGPTLTLIPTTSNLKPSERSQNYNPPGSRNHELDLVLRGMKFSCFLSYKPDSLESGRRSRPSVLSSTNSRSIGQTMILLPRPWTSRAAILGYPNCIRASCSNRASLPSSCARAHRCAGNV